MPSGVTKLIFVVVLVANCILFSQSRYGKIPRSQSHFSLQKRSTLTEAVYGNWSFSGLYKDQCMPLVFPVEEQCAHVQESCPVSDTFLSIPYAQRYYCAKPSMRPLHFASYLLWLLFLFSTLGISASDFFCPNLGTLSQILGLDENVAGVTFLAFGNGSPDVFATFSAMRTNSGGLAIGELLGAAAFVTSCVVGSMCIIKPFKVDRVPFLRDVGFFTLAVIVLLIVLWDSNLEGWEAAALVGLYLFYVLIVVLGSWWGRRKEQRRINEALMRDEYREEMTPEIPYINEPYRDDPTPTPSQVQSLTVPQTYARGRAISQPGPPRLGIELPRRPHTRSSSPHAPDDDITPHAQHMPSFSLIGALEFSRVVSSLQRDASSSSLSIFESPITPFPGGHYHHHSHHSHHHAPRSRSRTPVRTNDEVDPWDAALGLPLEQRSPQVDAVEGHDNIPDIPIISRTPASPILDTDTETGSQTYVPLTHRQRFWRNVKVIFHVLFPTLHNFHSKSFLGMIAALFAAPAVMMLTVTLPVVVSDFEDHYSQAEKTSSVGQLVDFEEEGVERALIAEEEVIEELHGLKFNKWLMAVQCVLGPLFCVAVLFDGTKHEPWLLLAAGVMGAAIGVLVTVFANNGESSSARLVRCAVGFAVAIVWIMAIADEVVEVLQTFGLIFGLSDAIIGLTIFAMGNSLADLVANMSVAVFAPIMGFSACFGGPMLNILLGIGISGSYIIRQTGEPYPLHFSTTLLITGIGLLILLLVTLIFIPWNNYFLPRSWGFTLIAAYTCLMIANIVAEIKLENVHS